MDPREHAIFRKQGDFWTISFGSEVVHLRDAKGLGYIAALLRRPAVRVHSEDLLEAQSPDAERARLRVTQRIKATLRRIACANPALADHLGRSIRTGYFCRYDPIDIVEWEL